MNMKNIILKNKNKRRLVFMKKRLLALFLSILIVVCSICAPQGTYAAAKVRLNKTRLKLTVGKTYKLKVKHYSGKVKWKSSNKKIVKVSS